MVGVVEHLAGDLGGRDERQVGDLGADLLERAMRLGLDLALRLLEPPLAVGLGLVLDALTLRVGDPARLGEDLLRLAARLADQRPVLLEQPARFRRERCPPPRSSGGYGRAARRCASWIGPNA